MFLKNSDDSVVKIPKNYNPRPLPCFFLTTPVKKFLTGKEFFKMPFKKVAGLPFCMITLLITKIPAVTIDI